MASLSIGSSSGLLSESSIGNDLVPTALPASGPFVSPILGSSFGLTGPNSLLPAGIGSVPSVLPGSILGLTGSSLLTSALLLTPTALGLAGPVTALPTTAIGLVTSPPGPVTMVVNTAVGALTILNPGTGAIGGVLGSM